ncbi:MAG: translocation/assembly module TamB domain-containing protein [Acidobacteria bacterium]|nr:translocation/assembly module TamB domain-containing protein [Acidobacteriota bacterium]
MRLHSIFRIREHVRVLVQKVRRVTVFLLVLGVLFSSLVVGKNVFLGEVRKEVSKTFAYDSLRASYFPPALVLENVRSLTGPPTFRARRVRVEVPYLSLLRNRKVLSVTLDSPELRLAPVAPGAPRPKAGRPRSAFSFPFIIERGLVENGSVSFETGAATVEVRGLRALVTQSGEEFSVRATAARSGYSSPAQNLDFGGALTVLLSGRGEAVKIDRLTVEGPDVALQAEGSIRNFLDPEVELDARFDIETAFLDAALRLPFEWKGKIGGEGKLRRRSGELAFETSIVSDDLVLCGVPMGQVRGRFDLAPATGGRIELAIQKTGLPAESLDLTFLNGRVEGRAAPVFLDPVFSELKIPWPVRSPAWGTFALENRKLAVDAEFRDSSLAREGDLFSFRGGAKVGVDFATQNVSVQTPGLESNFGRLEASAAIDLAGDIDARIRGQVFDVKQTREFVSLVLNETFGFGEIRGEGYADVRLSGRSNSPTVSLKATLSPGGFDLFDAAFVETDAVISGAGFDGTFDIDDPELKGQVRVRTDGDTLEVDVKNGEGELAKILPALEVPVSLSGRASGDFRMVQKAGGQEFSGSFTSPEIRGYGEKGGRVSGRLEWKDGILSFPELAMDFYGGRFDGRLLVGTVNGEFDFDLRGEELDFHQVVSAASGRLSLSLAGRGVFGKDKLGGLFNIKDMVLSPLEKTEARGDLQLDVTGGRVLLGLKGGLVPGENPFEAAFDFPLSGGLFSGVVKGRIGNLDLVWPWYGAQGHADYTADVKETEGPTRVAVALDVEAPVMPLPGFAYALIDFTASANYLDDVLTITSLGGKLGGGDVRGSGEVGIGASGIATMDLRLEAKDMVLSPMERMRTQADATLRLLKDKKRFVTEGEILFKRLTWRREIYEEFGFSSEAEPATDTGPSFFDGMSLNIRLRADENMIIENSLGKFNGRFNLTATGAFESPVLLGDIDILSGDFYFQDRSFRVLHGRLSFTDPVNTEPYLDFRGETYVKDFRVTLSMNGPVSRLKPEFTSSPPLPPEEILSLLALGESFRRMYYSYSGDRSTALNTASLLTYQIADLAKKGAGGLFSLDRFRIDPYIPESPSGGIAARITVGKKVSKDLLVLYSTILANSSVRAAIDEVPIFRVEWEISRRFSLVGGRDDRGKFGIDVKFRKRF